MMRSTSRLVDLLERLKIIQKFTVNIYLCYLLDGRVRDFAERMVDLFPNHIYPEYDINPDSLNTRV